MSSHSQPSTSLNRRQTLSLVEKQLKKENQAKAKRKREDIDLLSMKKPTTVDDIRARIPNPRETLPANALPEWKDRPLDSKLPAVPAPDGTFLVSQGEVGRKLFATTPNQAFDVNDPHMVETPVEYQPLHDPNLREFFHTNPVVCRQLVQLGLVTCDGKVIANLNDFNKYRAYLSRLHNGEVSREKSRMELWKKNDHEKGKLIKRYLQKVVRDQNDEERKMRRERNKMEVEERNRQRKIRSLEHPSNYLKEQRVIEARLRKAKREALRKNVMDRLKRVRDADKRRTRHILLEWICKDQFREKLRNVIKLEKELNKQESLVEFVDSKRSFQEQKQRYHKALLLRNKMETECRVKQREDAYAKKHDEDMGRSARNKELARVRDERNRYLAEKYGQKWLDMVRRNKRDSMHDSAWHIRSVLVSLLQYVKEESGAKNFTEYLHDILAKNKAKIDPETKKVVMCILDAIIERSYKEFIRRATSCLVDFVVEESRKRVLGFVCEEGLDPKDLESPIVPKKKRGEIQLRRPTYPLEGACTEFARTGEWPSKCVEELERLHSRLCISLLKKLTCGMKKACKTCGSGGLDRLEDRAKKARRSPQVCQAVDMVARMAMERARGCFKPENQPCEQVHRVNNVCDDLVGALLGPSKPKGKKGRKPSKRGKHGMGPAGGMGGKSAGQQSDAYATSDSEVDGVRIAPLAESSAGSEYGDRGIGGPLSYGQDTGVGGQGPGGQDKTTGRGPGADKGTGKHPGKGVSKGTGGTGKQDSSSAPEGTTTADGSSGMGPGVDQGLGPGAGAEAGVGNSQAMDGVDDGTVGEAGADGSTQATTGTGKDEGIGKSPDQADKGLGEGVSTAEDGTSGPGTGEAGTDGVGTKDGDMETEPGPDTASQGTGGGQKMGRGIFAPGQEGVSEGTDGTSTVDKNTGEPGAATTSQGTGEDSVVDKGVGKDTEAGVDAGTGGAPGEDKATGGPGTATKSDGTGTEKGVDKGTEGVGPGAESKGVGKDGGVDNGTQGPGVSTDSRGTDKDAGADGGTQLSGAPTDSRGTDREGGVDEETEKYPDGVTDGTQGSPDAVSRGTDKEGGTDRASEATGPETTSDGTDRPEGVDKGDGTEGPGGVDKGTASRPGDDAGTGTDTSPTDEQSAGLEPGKESGTDADGIPSDSKGTGTQPGKEGEAQAGTRPDQDKDTGTPAGTDQGTDSERKQGQDQGLGPEGGQEAGTQAKVSGQDQEADARGPAGLEEGTGPEGQQDQSTAPDGVKTSTDGTDADKGQDAGEGTGPGGPKKGRDGTQTDQGQEAGVGEPGEPGIEEGIGASPEGAEKGTEPSALGTDESGQTTGPEKTSAEVGGEPGSEMGVGPDGTQTGDQAVSTGGVMVDQQTGPCPPCACEVPCPPDQWDGREVTEEDLETELFRVDELLDNVKNEMFEECVVGEGPTQAALSTESEQAVDFEIDDILTCELSSLLGNESCFEKAGEYLREKCAALSGESKDKCLEEAAKQLREQCLTLSDDEREKCLVQVGKLLSKSSSSSDYKSFPSDTDDDLSRNASGLIHAILREQRARLSNELAVVGSGDEVAIGRIISDDNVSRIASALVRQSLCVAKCGPENLQAVGNVVPSPAVKCSVRDKLQHIRSILDEVKSDLAQVGIRPSFTTTTTAAVVEQPPALSSSSTRHSIMTSRITSKTVTALPPENTEENSSSSKSTSKAQLKQPKNDG